MLHNIANSVRAINKRDASLTGPKGADEIVRLERFLTRGLASNYIEFFSCCDGFIDGHSYMSIWTIEHIISNETSANVIDNFTIIGDILMESDYIITNLSDNESPVRLLYEDRLLSHNMKEFLESMSLGIFDMFKEK